MDFAKIMKNKSDGPSCACGREELTEPMEAFNKKEELSGSLKNKEIDRELNALKKVNKKEKSNKK